MICFVVPDSISPKLCFAEATLTLLMIGVLSTAKTQLGRRPVSVRTRTTTFALTGIWIAQSMLADKVSLRTTVSPIVLIVLALRGLLVSLVFADCPLSKQNSSY